MRASIVAVGLVLSACEWFHKSSPPPPTGPESVWYVTQTDYANAQPALVGDTLYVATGNGYVIARKTGNGAAIWAKQVASSRVRGANIVVAGNVIAVGIQSSTVGLNRQTGQLLWTYQAPPDTADGIQGGPGAVALLRLEVLDSTIFVPAWGGTIAAIDAATGNVKWQWKPPALAHRFGAEGVTARNGVVYASVWHYLNSNGTQAEIRIVALDANTGAEIYQTVLPYQGQAVCVSGRPAVTSTVVAVQTISGEVIAVNRSTGAYKWTAATETPAAAGELFFATLIPPSTAHDTLIADAGTGYLRALRDTDGQLLWKRPYTGEIDRELVLTSTRIFGSDGMTLHVFDRASGTNVQNFNQPNAGQNGLFAASVAADTANVYAPVNGAVWAFRHP